MRVIKSPPVKKIIYMKNFSVCSLRFMNEKLEWKTKKSVRGEKKNNKNRLAFEKRRISVFMAP